jgi:hypothetical protein
LTFFVNGESNQRLDQWEGPQRLVVQLAEEVKSLLCGLAELKSEIFFRMVLLLHSGQTTSKSIEVLRISSSKGVPHDKQMNS